jgi:acyl transferase domain-containing protein
VAALLAAEDGRAFLAMDNSPHQTVAGGEAGAIDRIARDAVAAGGVALALPFHHAFHTPLFKDWAAVLDRHYRRLAFGPGRVPVYSCFSTEPLSADAEQLRRTMVAQWTAAVRIGATIERMHADGVRTFIEVGPGSTLAPLVSDTLRGRPHVAVSVSDKRRGDVEHLHHVLAELFVAGLTVDPRQLAGLSVEPELFGWPVAGRGVHERLIAEARQQAARFGVTLDAPEKIAAPLIGVVSSATASSLLARRAFAPETDPFVIDHALGRSGSGPGTPLPVLAFTVSLEIVAEAASRLTGAPVQEIVDARASRWLALDGGRLVVETQATTVGPGDVEVRLAEASARAPLPAFEARARTNRSGRAADIRRLEAPARPQRWNVRDFYSRYAFHGPSFQTISEVTAIDAGGIEATLRTTIVPGLPPDSCRLDPAVLDAAGQLVAFWLLEHHGLAPEFAIIPVAARRVVIGAPPVPAGTTLACRGTMSRTDGLTEASFVFETPDGRPLMSIDGFVQRLVALPGWLARIIFGGASVSTIPARLDDADRAVLVANWRIWARALAHLGVDRSFLDDEHDDAR